MPRRFLRAVLVASLCGLVSWPAGGVSREAEGGLSAHAWYHTGVLTGLDEDGCVLAALCEAAPPANPYPAGTLHVGVTGGRGSARTYLRLDRSGLPRGAVPIDGVLDLPIADASAGTFRPEAAIVDACLAGAAFVTVEGGQPSDAPAVDCATTAAARFKEDRFKLDIGPFLAAWATGTPDHGLALLPREEAGATWRVVFSSRRRTGDGAPADPITARVRFRVPTGDRPTPAAAPPNAGGSEISRRIAPPAVAPVVAAVPEPQEPIPPFDQAAAPLAQLAPQAATSLLPPHRGRSALVPGAFYPAVWALPLLLVATGALLGRSFTCEMRVR